MFFADSSSVSALHYHHSPSRCVSNWTGGTASADSWHLRRGSEFFCIQ